MIKVDQLRKNFGSIVAVDGISFEVQPGEVLGFLGPNGAGKSTTMKILTCFLSPDGGSAQVAGCDILTDPVGVRQRVGYVPEHAPLYDDMTVHGFLSFIGDVRGIGGARLRDAIDRVVSTCAIDKVVHRRIERAEELARIASGDRILDLGPLKIDHGKRKVQVGGDQVQLTVKEYDLLYTLASRPGRTFSRRQLLDLIWDQDAEVFEHTVNSHVNRLRNKIEQDPNRPQLILTVWGVGYRFTEEFN